MANTYVDYTGDGQKKNYSFSFPFIKTYHVAVEVNEGNAGGLNKWVRKTIGNDYTVQTSPSKEIIFTDTHGAPLNLARIRVLRDSDASISLVDFANGSVLTETELDNAYLHNRYLAEEAEEGVSGGTISKNDDGQFNADGLRLENLADPDSDDDAVNKGYADGRYVDVAGDTMAGALSMGNNVITNIANPGSNQDAATKKYVDDTDAARKTYIDNAITTEATTRSTADSNLSDAISDEATARAAGDTANSDYTDTEVAKKVSKSGDTMSGNLNMATKKVTGLGAPSAGTDAATKTYVDTLVSGVDLSVAPSFTKLTGNGTTTDFSLTFNTNGVVSTAMLVTIDGAVQDPDDYLILGGSDEIQFTTPPPNNSEILVIERGFRPKTDLPTEYDWGFVADTTVTASYTYGQI